MAAEDIQELHEAITTNDLSSVTRLVRQGVDLNYCINRQTACTKAINVGDEVILDVIVEAPYFNPNSANQFDRTPLYAAAKNGQVNLAKRLLSLGGNVDQADILGITPLGAAAWYDHPEMADLLIAHGASVNKTSNGGESPLYRACKNNRHGMALALIRHGGDVNMATNDSHNHPGHTPLMAAICGVNYNVYTSMLDKSVSKMAALIDVLVIKGCDLNARDFRGRSALHLAVLDNNVCAVCLLLEAGCDVNLVDKFDFSPLHWAFQRNQQRHYLAKVLMLYGADVNFYLNTLDTKKRDALSMVREIEKKPLGSRKERHEMIRLVLSSISPYRLQNLSEISATEEKPVDVIDEPILDKLLLERQFTLQSFCRYEIRRHIKGGALNKIQRMPIAKRLKLYLDLEHDSMRFHPMHVNELYIAVGEEKLGRIKELIESGTDVEAPLWDKVPLTLAAELGHYEVVELLLSLGAKPWHLDASGDSALHLAVRNSHSTVARLLINTGVDVELRNKVQRTPLLEAAFVGDNTTFDILLSVGANPDVYQSDGITPLHYMAGNGNVKMVRRLLVLGMDPDVTDGEGGRPIHIAASKGRLYSAFLRLPALYRDEDQIDHAGVIRALLKGGCDVSVRNVHRRSALDIAKSIKHLGTQEIIKVLENPSEAFKT
ncbi:poly [ADP-ribose] polymerase tankyrase-like [Liolophura sinensis]|uniref:poly [ADP-ribose] polymerase tankyrase-like n=1 Tax=Liolophura sinensis TaxID=3198878 RepID=UPI003158653F